MTDFTIHTVETAPDAAKPLLEAARSKFSFVPNLIGGMAEAPALAEGYMTLNGIFAKTNLSETERQVILMTNNSLNGCTYCMAAHTTISKMAGVPEDVLESLRNETPIADAKLEALRQFTKIVVESRGWPSAEQVQALLDAGYTKQTVLEVVLGTGLKTLSNYANHILHTPVDDAFKANVWEAPTKEAAE
ncbi:MAG: carboxymuconolactone decarboxylase family protein [Pseudomonadota bacterium]